MVLRIAKTSLALAPTLPSPAYDAGDGSNLRIKIAD